MRRSPTSVRFSDLDRAVKAASGVIAVRIVHSSHLGSGCDKLAGRYEASLHIAIINDGLLTSL